MSYGTVSITTSTPAQLILAADNTRKSMMIYNNGNGTLYVGPDANVTTSNGIPILPQSSIGTAGRFENWRGTLYGISGSGTLDVRYWDWPA